MLSAQPTPPRSDATTAQVATATERRLAAVRPATHDVDGEATPQPDPFAAERTTTANNTADRITLPAPQDWVQAVQDRAKADNTTVLSVLIDAAAHVIARRAGAAHDATVVVGTRRMCATPGRRRRRIGWRPRIRGAVSDSGRVVPL